MITNIILKTYSSYNQILSNFIYLTFSIPLTNHTIISIFYIVTHYYVIKVIVGRKKIATTQIE
ncbi:hypothetical protein HLPCO_001958 [Haloplasma contractile SSD-17B]|uniref:Uncharacterized protein n=1 Tax=Haloplasma contractile SSD-17B TaxID=1033810 RepID=U2FLJ3_9MOLU|nr:hypothetical protein HLPCO_001958 [Haloplasma contractile SSD-17B]